mgnify:CR=1 FL=1
MTNLKGTEKQITWAIDIIKEMHSIIEDAKAYRLESCESEWSEDIKEKYNVNSLEDYKDYVENSIEESAKCLFAKQNAGWYIDNFRGLTDHNYYSKVESFSEHLYCLVDGGKSTKRYKKDFGSVYDAIYKLELHLMTQK